MKDLMLEDLRTIPGYSEFLNVLVPAVPPLPADVEEAELLTGQLSAYLINILSGYVGFSLLTIPFYMGQGNQVLQGLLLASLKQAAGGKILMIKPTNGAKYYGALTEVRCKVMDATTVTVTHNDDEFELEPETALEWFSLWAFPVGLHTIKVTATFPSAEPATLVVGFEVGFWDTYPADGAVLAAGSIEATLDPGDDELESVSVNGQSMIFDAASGAWKFTLEAASGAWEWIFTATKAGTEAVSHTIEVLVE